MKAKHQRLWLLLTAAAAMLAAALFALAAVSAAIGTVLALVAWV